MKYMNRHYVRCTEHSVSISQPAIHLSLTLKRNMEEGCLSALRACCQTPLPRAPTADRRPPYSVFVQVRATRTEYQYEYEHEVLGAMATRESS